MSKTAHVPPRPVEEEKDGFHYIRAQKLPESILAGSNPVYNARQQLRKHAGADYERDAERSDEMFDVFRCKQSDYEKVEKALQAEANDRVTRAEKNLTSYTGNGRGQSIDSITADTTTLEKFGNSLPSE